MTVRKSPTHQANATNGCNGTCDIVGHLRSKTGGYPVYVRPQSRTGRQARLGGALQSSQSNSSTKTRPGTLCPLEVKYELQAHSPAGVQVGSQAQCVLQQCQHPRRVLHT